MHGGPVGRSTEPGHDPLKTSHSPQTWFMVTKASFALIDGRNFIHQTIERLRMFLTENKSYSTQFDGSESIRTQIGWLQFDPIFIKIKTLIFDQIWMVQASSNGQEYSYGFNTFFNGFKTPFPIKKI